MQHRLSVIRLICEIVYKLFAFHLILCTSIIVTSDLRQGAILLSAFLSDSIELNNYARVSVLTNDNFTFP